ncbi:bd45b03e-fbc2-46c1-b170-28e28554ff30-CDS [Sclerotinia trifoliorum]|uniref:Bd45b03e-fbc2-46c1-b170-28e28554ff30-CDS n=1 Tax=Sclerotinia trifoliorum TaxID=28548 RepID=A0A8H2VUN2_9HELO|nr:bd45b03e-fbc2-46c1-b170-28e28554ff30-CDS [Sclerotinia trifoliorum]
MSSDSDSTPMPTGSSKPQGETMPGDFTSAERVKPSQPDVHRLKVGDEHRDSPISTPDSMKVETGSEGNGTAEPVSPHEDTRAKQKGDEDNRSDESWEEVKHEGTQATGEAAQDSRPVWVGHSAAESATQEEEGLGEDIAPEFRPRTPRPYNLHGE